jgi:hypothetical protein
MGVSAIRVVSPSVLEDEDIWRNEDKTMRYMLAMFLSLGIGITAAVPAALASERNGPVVEIHRDAGKPQDRVNSPGYTTLPSPPLPGYDTGYSTTVPAQPFWVVQFSL